jgi:hypothetical protein
MVYLRQNDLDASLLDAAKRNPELFPLLHLFTLIPRVPTKRIPVAADKPVLSRKKVIHERQRLVKLGVRTMRGPMLIEVHAFTIARRRLPPRKLPQLEKHPAH